MLLGGVVGVGVGVGFGVGVGVVFFAFFDSSCGKPGVSDNLAVFV